MKRGKPVKNGGGEGENPVIQKRMYSGKTKADLRPLVGAVGKSIRREDEDGS